MSLFFVFFFSYCTNYYLQLHYVSRRPLLRARALVINRPSSRPILQPSTMPTTRSTAPVNRSGLQRGSQPSKRKRSNADEQARKRLKDEINTEIDNDSEEQKQKTKGGRGGKKVKGIKKKNHLRCVSTLLYFRCCTN